MLGFNGLLFAMELPWGRPSGDVQAVDPRRDDRDPALLQGRPQLLLGRAVDLRQPGRPQQPPLAIPDDDSSSLT